MTYHFNPAEQAKSFVQENYGTYRILCFDTWMRYDKVVDIEAWIVTLADEDIDYILDELRSGKRDCLTQDLLADYNSDHYDEGSEGYLALEEEVANGLWTPEAEWLEGRL